MSWHSIAAPFVAPPLDAQMVRVGLSESPRCGKRLCISLRPGGIEGADFIRPGECVMVHVGRGEHTGLLRIMPGDEHRVKQMGNTPRKGALPMCQIQIPAPDGIGYLNRTKTACEFDTGGEGASAWLEITLPIRPGPRTVEAPFA